MVSTVAGLLSVTAAEHPAATALVEAGSGRSVTWAALEDLVDAVAEGLSRAGLVAGQRVLLVLGNRVELVAAYLGALRGGLVVVPLNPRGSADELARVVADCGPRLVVADAATVENVRRAAPGCPVVCVGVEPAAGETGWDSLLAEPRRRTPLPGDREALAVLLYTSGTSGRPRAAMLTHRALLADVEQLARVEPPTVAPDDVVLGLLPLFHVYGLNAVLGQVLRTGARLVLLEGFDPAGSLEVVGRHAVSVLPVAPAVLERWRRLGLAAGTPLDGVRLVLSGSAPLEPDLAAWFTTTTGVPVHQGYGLTEAAPVVTSTLCVAGEPTPGSVGAALPGVELRLVDELGRPAEGDDPGEIRVRGDNLFSGYWPDGAEGPDTDGWWSTGDVGLLDDRGQLFLVDRVKELVLVSGFNVYPREVEDVVREVPGVARTAVIGTHDPATGEAVVAYVTPADGADHDRLPGLVRDHCARRLARFKQPTAVHVVAALPLTVTGKVEKGRLRAAERSRAMGLEDE